MAARISVRFWTALATILTLSCAPGDSGAAPAQQGGGGSRLPLDEIKLPPGFAIDVYSDQVPNARQMALSPSGILYVGSREEGKVYAVVDLNRDGRADKVHVIASGLKMPSGVAFRDGALYVGAVERVLRWDGIDARVADPPRPVVVSEAFPSDATTAGSSSPSVPTACCTCRSAPPATSARGTSRSTPRSPG